ncbi:MAG: CRISPR-associated endonuclease Cas2 [Thermoanaerobaculia bacterium]|nr:CRISPR-associated endonuclease Cas2 [Thermoanaerobaculia bacterium]
MTERSLWLFAYDVASDRRRLRLMRLLANVGTRINLSVFECVLTAEEAERYVARATRLLRRGEDRLYVYRICAACRDRRVVFGAGAPADGPIVHLG